MACEMQAAAKTSFCRRAALKASRHVRYGFNSAQVNKTVRCRRFHAVFKNQSETGKAGAMFSGALFLLAARL